MAILVTGAAGFIGSRFVEALNAANASKEIIAVDLESHFHDRKELHDVRFGTRVDRKHLFDWLESAQPDIESIVHLGACTDTTELNWDYLREINLEYSQKLWNLASRRSIPMVYASSAATYGSGENGYEDRESEMSDLKPLNPYGRSKLEFDLWALGQERAGNAPPAWAGFKFFNVYGFGERHKEKMSSVVLQAFDQIRLKGSVRLFKSYRPDFQDGEQKRDFIHVDDVIRVLRFALEKPIRRGIFNLGTGKARSFLDLARATFSAMGKPERIEFIEMPQGLAERYQYFTQADMSKLCSEGYTTPFLSLEEGAKRTVDRLMRALGTE